MIEKCGQCHHEGGIGPIALDDYKQASAWAPLALEAIESGQMPPWGAADTPQCVPRHPFKHDPRLSDEQLALFADWITEGAPDSAAPIPEPTPLALEDADLRVTIPGDIEVGPGADQFWCFVLDPGFSETTLIDATQVVVGNQKIVHHVLVYTRPASPPGKLAMTAASSASAGRASRKRR